MFAAKNFFFSNNITGWYNVFGSVTPGQSSVGLGVDSSANTYIGGITTSQTAGAQDYLLAKLNSAGALQWQRTIGGSFGFEIMSGIFADSLGNTYLCGRSLRDGSTVGAYIVKYDTTGAVAWQDFINVNSTQYMEAAVDSSSNVYVFARYPTSISAGLNDFAIIKYNSSGTIQWQRTIGGASADNVSDGVATTGGDSYAVGQSASISSPAGTQKCYIVKYNTSGTLQWQRALGNLADGNSGNFNGCAIDSSDNLYACGNSAESGTAILVKYNSSGTIQWQRGLATVSSFIKMAINSAGTFVYVLGSISDSFFIAKYDSSGNIQWQRTFGTFGTPNDIVVDSSENVYVSGSLTGGQYFFTVKLPASPGTYGAYTYADTTYTTSTTTLASNTPTLASVTRSAANLNPAYANVTTRTFTSTTTDI